MWIGANIDRLDRTLPTRCQWVWIQLFRLCLGIERKSEIGLEKLEHRDSTAHFAQPTECSGQVLLNMFRHHKNYITFMRVQKYCAWIADNENVHTYHLLNNNNSDNERLRSVKTDLLLQNCAGHRWMSCFRQYHSLEINWPPKTFSRYLYLSDDTLTVLDTILLYFFQFPTSTAST